MVSKDFVNEQLNKLGFNVRALANRAELEELPNIIIPDENIFECVNGYYEGGFALLVATNIRVILIDKKPLNFLTVEDLRFDMINQIDYSHRLLDAQINISVGSKFLKFRSYNKARLRKLINHVQHCIADVKKQQSQNQLGQNQHLEQINQQLQAYLLAQYQNQQLLNQRLQESQIKSGVAFVEAPKPHYIEPSPELADYLFAQSLLRQHERQSVEQEDTTMNGVIRTGDGQYVSSDKFEQNRAEDLYAAGRQEVFNKSINQNGSTPPLGVAPAAVSAEQKAGQTVSWEINPLRIAYAKLPTALRRRRNVREQTFTPPKRLPVIPPMQP